MISSFDQPQATLLAASLAAIISVLSLVLTIRASRKNGDSDRVFSLATQIFRDNENFRNQYSRLIAIALTYAEHGKSSISIPTEDKREAYELYVSLRLQLETLDEEQEQHINVESLFTLIDTIRHRSKYSLGDKRLAITASYSSAQSYMEEQFKLLLEVLSTTSSRFSNPYDDSELALFDFDDEEYLEGENDEEPVL